MRTIDYQKIMGYGKLFYTELFLKPVEKRIASKKFYRIQPFVLPLQHCVLPKQSENTPQWSVSLVKKRIDIRQFIPPKGHRVNERAFDKEHPNWVKSTPMELLYDCRPLDKRSPIKRVLLATHVNAQVSVMVMPHVGVSQQVLKKLTGIHDEVTLDDLDTPQTPNGFVFQYAPKAGTDLRARGCLTVKVDNDHDISRIESILACIHQITPMGQPLLDHCHDLLTQCHHIKNRLTPNSKDELKQWWQPVWKMESTLIKEGFDVYPNHIPDILDNNGNYLYNPDDCLAFPSSIPAIHLAILAGDRDLVQEMVASNPNVVYQRNPWGHLPIEVANAMRDLNIAADLYDAWEQLPADKQWAHTITYRCANNISHLEHSANINGDDPEQRKKRVDSYLSDCLPGITNALAVYQAIQANDETSYQQLMAAHIVPWQQLNKACQERNLVKVRHLLADLMPGSQQLFAAALREDFNDLQVAMHDYFPDLSDLIRIWSGSDDVDWDKALQCAEQPILKDWEPLQQALHKKDLAQTKLLLSSMPKKWWNLRDQSENNFVLFDYIKKQLCKLGKNTNMQCITQTIIDHLTPWYQVKYALEHQDAAMLARCKDYFTGKDKPDFLKPGSIYASEFKIANHQRLRERLFNRFFIPDHLILVYAALVGDLQTASIYINTELKKAELLLSNAGNISNARHNLALAMPQRTTLHHQALRGKIPNEIDNFKIEQNAFEQVMQQLLLIGDRYFELVEQSISSLPTWLRNFEFQGKYVKYSMQDCWQIFSRHLVINKNDYVSFCTEIDKFADELKQYMQPAPTASNQTKPLQDLNQQVQKIKQLQLQVQQQFQMCFKKYRPHCQVMNPIQFEIYMTAMACLQFQTALQKIKLDFRFSHFQPVRRLLDEYKPAFKPARWQQFSALHSGGEIEPTRLIRILRSGLLSFECQDTWGYTPLLLAVIADKHAFVETFLSRGLFADRIKVLYEYGWAKHYRLLDHARSAQMVELLLRYFVNPNTRTQLTLRPNPDIACRMRDYEHRFQLDYEKLTLTERIIGGYWQGNNIKDLQSYLAYENDFLPAGPYDLSINKAIAKCIKTHNQRIAKKRQQRDKKPRAALAKFIVKHGVSAIETEFKVATNIEENHYHSSICCMSHLDTNTKHSLAKVFAECFKIRSDEEDSPQARIDYFLQQVASNNDYYIDIYTDSHDKVCGFFCFQIKRSWHPNSGDFMVFYASLAAFNQQTMKCGLASSSFRTMLVAKQFADAQGIALQFYGRIDRRGIAYLLNEESAQLSSKYAIPPEWVKFIAEDLFSNVVEKDGSSIPPVLSTAKRTHDTPRLKFFDHLLKEVHNAVPDASLPLVYEVSETVAKSLLERLKENHDIDAEHIEKLTHDFQQLFSPNIHLTAKI